MTKLTMIMRIKIADLLRIHCSARDGYAVYENGWSDERVAETAGAPEAIRSVQDLRRALIGREKRQRSGKPTLASRVSAIEEYLTRANPNWR